VEHEARETHDESREFTRMDKVIDALASDTCMLVEVRVG